MGSHAGKPTPLATTADSTDKRATTRGPACIVVSLMVWGLPVDWIGPSLRTGRNAARREREGDMVSVRGGPKDGQVGEQFGGFGSVGVSL